MDPRRCPKHRQSHSVCATGLHKGLPIRIFLTLSVMQCDANRKITYQWISMVHFHPFSTCHVWLPEGTSTAHQFVITSSQKHQHSPLATVRQGCCRTWWTAQPWHNWPPPCGRGRMAGLVSGNCQVSIGFNRYHIFRIDFPKRPVRSILFLELFCCFTFQIIFPKSTIWMRTMSRKSRKVA